MPSQQLTAVDQAQPALRTHTHISIVNIGILTRALDSIMCLFLAASSYLCDSFACVLNDCQKFSQLFSTDSAVCFNFLLFSFFQISLSRSRQKDKKKHTFYHCSKLDYFISVHALFNISDCLCVFKVVCSIFSVVVVFCSRVVFYPSLFFWVVCVNFVLRETKLRSPSQTCIFLFWTRLFNNADSLLILVAYFGARANCISDCFRDF